MRRCNMIMAAASADSGTTSIHGISSGKTDGAADKTDAFLNRMGRVVLLMASLLMFAGCTTYGKISNRSSVSLDTSSGYSMQDVIKPGRPNRIALVLAFSGGGSRASALAYSVLTGLRDTKVRIDGEEVRLLDEIDMISSVSGGSFTAAYFGLHGDHIFDDFEDRFLRLNVTGQLLRSLFNPSFLFSSHGRTEMAVEYYEDRVFDGATFYDIQHRNGPLIVINATDLGRGVRFSFLQSYFDLLCSDLSSFPVARAVTASSAVPILFNPVVLENYPGCRSADGEVWLDKAKKFSAESPNLSYVVEGLSSYSEKDKRRYIHLVDGGITDNLGLLAIYDIIGMSGGPGKLLDSIGGKPLPYFVVISVNASTTPQYDIESSRKTPSIENVVNSVTDIQLHRTNVATVELIQNSMKEWAEDISTSKVHVKPYFIDINFQNVSQPERRFFLNQIPTTLSLTDKQVDNLLVTGRELLQKNEEFARLLEDLK